MPKPINIKANGRIVGQVKGNAFTKTVSGSKHFLRSPKAIALDTQSVADARKAGATLVEVVDRETGLVYRASIDRLFTKGFSLDRGYGSQIALSITDWNTSDTRQLGFQL
jgi:hypothetical protein